MKKKERLPMKRTDMLALFAGPDVADDDKTVGIGRRGNCWVVRLAEIPLRSSRSRLLTDFVSKARGVLQGLRDMTPFQEDEYEMTFHWDRNFARHLQNWDISTDLEPHVAIRLEDYRTYVHPTARHFVNIFEARFAPKSTGGVLERDFFEYRPHRKKERTET